MREVLAAHRGEILARWMARVRREVPALRGLDDEPLIDNLGLLIDRLIEAFGGVAPPAVLPEPIQHAEHRRRQGIDLPAMLAEYLALQQAIKGVAVERLGRSLNDEESGTIDAIWFQALQETVLAYSKTREADLSRGMEQRDRLLMTLAHDIRTPLNAMTLTLTLLEAKLGDRLDDDDRADLASLRAGMSSVLDLHRGILDRARLSAGRLAPSASEFDLDGVLEGCLRVVRPLASFKGLALDADLAASAVVRADRAMLQQIVGNLLSNAIRYTVRGRVALRSRRDGSGIRVEVEDTGVGLDPEDQARIFDDYFQVGAAPRRLDEGIGLGLTVARQMARLMGGDLTVRSTPGQGSTFTLTLPTG